MENLSPNPQLIEKLTTILEQAQSGELTSFAAITFKRTGGVDKWGFLTRHEDLGRVVEELEDLTAVHREMMA